MITKEVERINLKNEDGKIELAFDKDRNLMVVDVVGTPDESRYTFRGYIFLKRSPESFIGTSWFEEVEKAKLPESSGLERFGGKSSTSTLFSCATDKLGVSANSYGSYRKKLVLRCAFFRRIGERISQELLI